MKSKKKKTLRAIVYIFVTFVLVIEFVFAGYLSKKDKELKEQEANLAVREAQLNQNEQQQPSDTPNVEETKPNEEPQLEPGEKNGLKDSNIYVLGDSIMKGTVNIVNNEPYGVARVAAEKFNATILGDTSFGGAMLTDYGINGESLSNIASTQIDITQKLVDMRGYDDKTIVILDGGANDCNIMDMGTNYISINDPNSEGNDVCQSTEKAVKRLIHMFGNDNPEQAYKVPIVYVITDYNISGFRTDCYNAQVEVLKKYRDYGVYYLRESEYLNGADFGDWLHPNINGTVRLTTLIDIALTNRQD